MGMFVECQNELIKALKAAGVSKEPFISRKKLVSTAESKVSAVLCEEETVERDRQSKIYTGENGTHLKRSRIYKREITFLVIIGDYTNDAIEQVYEKFLQVLPKGIYVDGNYTSIAATDTDWVGEKDHVLYAKVSVQIKVTCSGGLYKDTGMAQIKDVDLKIRKER